MIGICTFCERIYWRNTFRYNVDCLAQNSNISYLVIQDFAHYKSGVYKHVTGEYIGGHAVKLIGWGTSEEGEDYWVCCNYKYPFKIMLTYQQLIIIFFFMQLLVNSWNKGWGNVCPY